MTQKIHYVVVRGSGAFVMGKPEDGEDGHNCDAYGCASVGDHILAWVPVEYLPAGNSTTFYAEINELVNRRAAETVSGSRT